MNKKLILLLSCFIFVITFLVFNVGCKTVLAQHDEPPADNSASMRLDISDIDLMNGVDTSGTAGAREYVTNGGSALPVDLTELTPEQRAEVMRKASYVIGGYPIIADTLNFGLIDSVDKNFKRYYEHLANLDLFTINLRNQVGTKDCLAKYKVSKESKRLFTGIEERFDAEIGGSATALVNASDFAREITNNKKFVDTAYLERIGIRELNLKLRPINMRDNMGHRIALCFGNGEEVDFKYLVFRTSGPNDLEWGSTLSVVCLGSRGGEFSIYYCDGIEDPLVGKDGFKDVTLSRFRGKLKFAGAINWLRKAFELRENATGINGKKINQFLELCGPGYKEVARNSRVAMFGH